MVELHIVRVDVDVSAADDVSIDDGVAAATWPVSPSGGFPIDGLVAAQVAVARGFLAEMRG